ncbi:M48 family metallopeptidase [Ramlibacter ginsenosidimutans]|uniref:M48 family metallopeptidase n=1 Tax=Ramlibacter ginsenosidimutans TaxID=502333 RepID=A0A934TQD1_9BURK|nr:M48 family metallopeptidase [Ramlibacter ginsenosidimutans]MBK6005484.1 M48 family metallopeptidase [Ramlibacter ginsenosidimutans]
MRRIRAVPPPRCGSRRAFLLTASSLVAAPVFAQVNVGPPSSMRSLVPAEELEQAATQQYGELLEQARSKNALAPDNNPQLQRLRAIAGRLIVDAPRWNERARQWHWEVNLIGSKQVNAFCMPGGKIAVFTGLLQQLQVTDDELAMVLGHEMAHALREHARERIAKTQGTGALLSLGAQLFGLGQLGNVAADIGTQLLSLKYSRDDETEADLVGLELGARAGFNPEAAVSLWEKMDRAAGAGGGMAFLSTHPSGPDRMRRLKENIPRVEGLYRQALARR